MRAFLALLIARNKEFYRDRATLAWNFVFPLVVIFGLALVFSGSGREVYKVGVQGDIGGDAVLGRFLGTEYIQFVPVDDLPRAMEKVRHHQLDLLLQGGSPPRYWVNATNPKGYMMERVLWGTVNQGTATAGRGTTASHGAPDNLLRENLEGREIRYVDWLVPGVLGMNMMFSCLWGVGYVIVRYRKGGVLRRFKAAPIHAVQFLAAQVVSRMLLVMAVTALIFLGTDLVLDFFVLGSLWALAVVYALGGICLISMGVLLAARTASQELAGGLMNMATWPMMFLSGVWFSLEGSPDWVVSAAALLPLTHLNDAARGIMVDGLTLAQVWPQLATLGVMSVVFLALGAALFRWE